MVTGIVLASLGPLVWLLGLKAVSNAETSCLQGVTLKYASTSSPERATEASDCHSSARTGSNAVWITGAVLLGAGAPMIGYGAKKVSGPRVTASLAPVVAPGHVGLQLRVDM